MKTTAIIIVLTLVSVAIATFTGCQHPQDNKEYVLFADITDDHQLKPEVEAIKQGLGYGTDIWCGINFTYLEITDLELNSEKQIFLTPSSHLLGNQLSRKREVETFFQELDKLVLSPPVGEKGYSAIYRPLAKKLNEMGESEATERRVFIYSDLMENSGISFYDTETFSKAEQEPEIIIAQFQAQEVLRDLSGITIHLLFNPRDREQDRMFAITSSLFKKMFERHGAKVVIQASLNLGEK